MIETREQENRAQALLVEYPHGVGVLPVEQIPFAGVTIGATAYTAQLLTCHDAQARPVHREIVLPDGTRFVEAPVHDADYHERYEREHGETCPECREHEHPDG